ncbi:DNA-binding FadR family transcriptional regulator [Mobilisporobacter senegalensis]|uniref:DNA-binding FadR family transcriptional regulator n=1 Tax=Mobilisporobacter senegalensis TaxID=1329262 RepID=A0A3N1XQ09_9FIRM|nr:GntR family transcriptional regulator [Mobilisporobacter senegalensis]ROR27182.1 DNA-binding FadR family transcriptional regulator [Mobilisporobacter senegalensis]
MEFTKLSAPSLKELFVQELEGMILSGKLAVGEKLPPEREMAKTMQVSRTVVNSGILELSRKGFLIIKPRVGTFIADYRRTGTLETLISILKYNGGVLRSGEIRSILEIRLALSELSFRLTIPKLTEKDINSLRKYVDGIGKSSTNKEASERAFEFHHELSILSGNMLLPLVYYSFKEAVLMLWERFCILHGREKLFTNTETLWQFIEKKDVEGAICWSKKTIYDTIQGKDQIYY